MSAHLQKSSGMKFHKYVPFQDQIEVALPDRTWPDKVITEAPRWCAAVSYTHLTLPTNREV